MKKDEADKDLTIKSLTVTPKSRNFYNFYINGTSEKRSMKPEKLIDLITELCPAVGGEARTMIYEFRPFYVEVETDTILELTKTPPKPRSHKDIVFDGRKKVFKSLKDAGERKFVDDRKDRIFKNILKLSK